MLWCALILIILVWAGAIIWSVWSARWIVAAIVGLLSVVGVILACQWIGGRDAVGYGIALGLSIFLASAMLILGLIAIAIKWLARLDRG